jgi:signal transduction histidine kinase
MRHDRGVRRAMTGRLRRLGGASIPWAVAIFLLLVVGDEEPARSGLDTQELAMVLAVVQGVALHWRRKHPELVMAVVLVSGLGYQLIVPEIVIPIAGLFAIGSLAAARPPRVSLPGLVALVGLAAINFFTTNAGDTLFAMGLAVGAWALGEAARNRRAAIEEEARRAAGDEQARIARELHDVIAHSVSIIVVQASAADDVFDTRPDQARAALRSIEQAGRDALRELRTLLSGGAGDPDPTHPQPGLARLDELAEPLRLGGLDVVVRREGDVAEVPAGVDLSAYRIVQEALTNTLRHARATRAEVTVRYDHGAVELEVRDDGRGSVAAEANGAPGRGLVGMRERAALLGGTLEAGPMPGGGYRVHARLPLGTAP